MERLQGPLPSCFFGEPLLEQLVNSEQQEQEHSHLTATPSLQEKMSFLQMLQGMESSPFPPNFQTFLKQRLKTPWEMNYVPEIQTLELEQCMAPYLLANRLSKNLQQPPLEIVIRPQNGTCRENPNPLPGNRERKRRRRARTMKNKEDVESQRMTHIAVERNRRRQMKEHLNALRCLMPPSYVQRGDQASIIGGAIDFVKELEQLLQSLETQQRTRKTEESGDSSSSIERRVDNSDSSTRPDRGTIHELMAARNTEAADIRVTVIQTHVNLKIWCPRRPRRLLKAIVALEDLRLAVLHLNITSMQDSVLYSFNLKMEEECKLGSAAEIVAAVHQIFEIDEPCPIKESGWISDPSNLSDKRRSVA